MHSIMEKIGVISQTLEDQIISAYMCICQISSESRNPDMAEPDFFS